MALIRCPECGREISDLSSACVHCGYPLSQLPDDAPACSLVLLDAQPGEKMVLQNLCRDFHMSQAEAEQCAANLPAVLLKGVPAAKAYEAARNSFSGCGLVKVVRDSDTRSPEAILHAAPVADNQTIRRVRPLTFWSTVGAILTAFALWWLISLVLSAIVNSL